MSNFMHEKNSDWLFVVTNWKQDADITKRYTEQDDYRAFEKACFSSPIYSPIAKMIYQFCRRQTTDQGIDCKTVSGNGIFFETQNYRDYVQTVFCELFEMALDNPEDSFIDTLFIATKKGMRDCFKSYHSRHKWLDKEGKEHTSVTVHDDIEKHYELYDKTVGYDYSTEDLEQHLDNEKAISKAMENASEQVKTWCKLYAEGQTFKQIARVYGKTENAVRNAIKRLG